MTVKDNFCNKCRKSMFGNCEFLKQNCKDVRGSREYYKFVSEFTCDNFDSMFIQYPTEISDIEIKNKYSPLYSENIGKYCKIRYCKDDKTYLGLFLGELPHDINVSINRETKILSASFRSNPAMFIFELNKIVFGYESWWGLITTEDDLKEITDLDISNVWYVKALKSLESDKDVS